MSLLLAVDVGNTNTKLGVYDGDTLRGQWRIETNHERTADEYAVLVQSLLAMGGVDRGSIRGGIVSAVVPAVLFALEDFFRRHLEITPLVVGPGIKTGMPILYENPREVGPDRIVVAVAAYDKLKTGCIVVGFGTATTFDLVSPAGEYLGGAIAPGIRTSAEALYRATARLPRIEIVRPSRVVGRSTVASMQSGIVFGYAGMVDGLVERMRAEVDFPARCIATGGLAPLIARETRTIEESDEHLTLRGLKILFDRNQ